MEKEAIEKIRIWTRHSQMKKMTERARKNHEYNLRKAANEKSSTKTNKK